VLHFRFISVHINAHVQGNLSDQLPVTIFDPIHDTVRVALEQKYPFGKLTG
jgi:hypothetical protein